MGELKYLFVENYRSVGDEVRVRFPGKTPVVLVGENNAGKTNIARALDLVLGESWPANHEPDDHEFHLRDRTRVPMRIKVEVDGVEHRGRAVSEIEWRDPPAGGSRYRMMHADGTSQYMNNEVRAQCTSIYIGADRRLSYELSYVSRFTLLSKLMKRFHTSLVEDHNRTERLRSLFDGVKSVFAEVEEFQEFSRVMEEQVEDFSKGMEYRLEVDFSAYDPSNYFHALRVQAKEGDAVRTLDELGTGQEQLLALSFVYAYARAFHGEGGLVLIIEEPESHLHPLAQRWLAEKMGELANAGVQVVLTTHSPAFVDVMKLEGIVVARRVAGATGVTQLTTAKFVQHCVAHGAQQATVDGILPFYAAAATDETLSGLFSRKVVLVEGPTEALALPVLLRRVGFDPVAEGTAIVPVHGVGNLAKWWRFYSAYGIPAYCVFDNDSSEDPRRLKRVDLLQSLAVSPEQIEVLLSADEWVISDHVTVFGTQYERALEAALGSSYSECEEKARQAYDLEPSRAKPLVARFIAEHVSLPVGSEGWTHLEAMADAIRALE